MRCTYLAPDVRTVPHASRLSEVADQEEEEMEVRSTSSYTRGYVLAAVLGAIGGGLIVTVATRAIPKMMSGMMRNMMAQMGEGGCSPAEM